MKEKFLSIALFLSIMFTFSSCSKDNNSVVVEIDKKEDTMISEYVKVDQGEIDLNQYKNNVGITESGEYILVGTLTNKMIYVDANGEVTLNLDSVNISNTDGPCIYVHNAEKVIVNLIENSNNKLSMTGNSSYDLLNAALYSRDDLEFAGSGNLEIKAVVGHAINGNDGIVMGEDGKYIISSQEDCINVNNDLVINGGQFTLISGDEGMKSDETLVVNNGIFDIESQGDAVKAEVLLTINDGDMSIKSNSEGLESKDAIMINGGKVDIEAVDDCINASNMLTVNDGEIYAVSETNDGLDSNGTIEINDGYVYAIGLTMPEGAIDCDMNDLKVNGGTVIGVGTVNSNRNNGNQNILIVNYAESDAEIKNLTIKDAAENIVLETAIIESFAKDSILTIQGMHMPSKDLFNMPKNEHKDVDNFDKSDFSNEKSNLKNVEGVINSRKDKMNMFNDVEMGNVYLFISCEGLVDGIYTVYINGESAGIVDIISKVTTMDAKMPISFT